MRVLCWPFVFLADGVPNERLGRDTRLRRSARPSACLGEGSGARTSAVPEIDGARSGSSTPWILGFRLSRLLLAACHGSSDHDHRRNSSA